jgi:tetratricopeptide (TPR) repeat protein
MWLVQAIAWYWLGKYAEAETCALDAMRALGAGTSGWYAALGHAAMSGGPLGRAGQLASTVDTFRELRAGGHAGPFFVVASCRLLVQLVRTGQLDLAQELLDGARASVKQEASIEPFVRAWLAVVQGELAAHVGDPLRYLAYTTAAVDEFGAAGDVRNASLQRSNIGNAYLLLGAYPQAERVLREAVDVAEPMRLSIAAPVRANLGFALARLGHLDEALAVESSALEQCVLHGNRRFEGVARVYLATIHSLRGDLDAAIQSARDAIAASESAPAVRAYALAALAGFLLIRGPAAAALDPAREAHHLLDRLDGVEEGESLIRVVHASALTHTGDHEEGGRRIVEAQDKLLARAERITDPRWRQSFLFNVPENARTLRLAEHWATGDVQES